MVPVAGGLLQGINRALRGQSARAARRAGVAGAKKSKKSPTDLSLRVDKLPQVQAAVKLAGAGAKVVGAKIVTGSRSSKTVFTELEAAVTKDVHRWARETPGSAKGRLRQSVYNQYMATQVLKAKQYAENARRRLRRKLGRMPTRDELQDELRRKPFVGDPMPTRGNIIETRQRLKEAMPADIPLAPLRFKTTSEAVHGLRGLPDDVRETLFKELGPERVDALLDLMAESSKSGKAMSAAQLSWLSKTIDSIEGVTPVTATTKKAADVIKRRVARAEERVVVGTTTDPDVVKGAKPAKHGKKEINTREPAAVEVEIRDAAGNVTTERFPLADVAATDPSLRRHHTRVGKRVRKKRRETTLGPADEVSEADLVDDIAGGFGDVDFQTQGNWVSRNKALTGLLGVDALAIGGPMALGVAGGLQQDITGENFANPQQGRTWLMEQQGRMVREQAHHQGQVKHLQSMMAQNMGRLAAVAPDIYNQVLAGQQLPQGGVVIGGQPRQDLMEQLAYDMSTGGYPSQQGQDALLQSYAQ